VCAKCVLTSAFPLRLAAALVSLTFVVTTSPPNSRARTVLRPAPERRGPHGHGASDEPYLGATVVRKVQEDSSEHGALRNFITQCWNRGVEIELMHRAFGFAALGFVTLVPLLIVVAAAAPLNHRTFSQWIIAGIGLSGKASHAVNGLFAPSTRVLSTTTALSVGVLAVFGLSFVTMVQTGLARVWDLPAARLISVWRRVVWLAALVGVLLVGADMVTLLNDSPLLLVLRWCATGVGATCFIWWTTHFLLEDRVSWVALLPGALLTVAGLVGLRLFSAVIFSPLIVSSAVTYGAVGTMLMVVSWLIGIGYVFFGAALVGRAAHESIDGHDGVNR
jgi:membrane protein